MFDALTNKLTAIFSQLRGRGTLTEAEVASGLRQLRLALLEADVHYKVVKNLLEQVRERAVGEEIRSSLSPAQQLVKIVRDELTALMGHEHTGLSFEHRPAVILLVGLQGSGKTTTAAKLALRLKKDGRKPFLVGVDIRRPAAAAQLRILGETLDVPVFPNEDRSPPEIAASALDWAKRNLYDTVIIDTAGRLHIDETMMKELEEIEHAVSSDERLLVADAMTGQDAVNIAAKFNESLPLTGVILTKLDGDARGGAALSIRHVTGCPIKFVGTGEKIKELEAFHPKRMAERILGMGDVLSLIERAEEEIDRTKAEEVARRIQKDQLTLQDFLEQLEAMRKLGPVAQILDKLPGGGRIKVKARAVPEDADVDRALAILRSMTVEERLRSSIIGGSRKKRIARGSGTKVQDVNRVLARFEETKKALKQVTKTSRTGGLPPNFLARH
jgi:signal recognition particle subunit SRP54